MLFKLQTPPVSYLICSRWEDTFYQEREKKKMREGEKKKEERKEGKKREEI